MRPVSVFVLLLLSCTLWTCSEPTDNPTISTNEVASERPNILVLIADDWSYPHAGAYADPIVRTPTFDWLAENGLLFSNAYCAAPSCSPSRAALLTGRYPHQLDEGGNLWSEFPARYAAYPAELAAAGYHVGSHRKGWGPGDYEAQGYEHNPAGKHYASLPAFLDGKTEDQPFCFWMGSSDPHRVYETNTGVKSGMDPAAVELPSYYPDNPCVRNDWLDYYFEVERFDRQCGHALNELRRRGLLENTLVVMTSDNGMPFPRAKANLYDPGTRVPLVVYWADRLPRGRRVDAFVNAIHLAPTILDAAGVELPPTVTGRSLLGEWNEPDAAGGDDLIFLERERHANVRSGDLSYPVRGVRNDHYLYLRNFEPDRWPAGDPSVHRSLGQYGDVDNSITKYLILRGQSPNSQDRNFRLSFGKRPAEELYYLDDDPEQTNNLINEPDYGSVLRLMRARLDQFMVETEDRRAEDPATPFWDEARYTIEYQHENFNVEEKIAGYPLLVPTTMSAFAEADCLE